MKIPTSTFFAALAVTSVTARNCTSEDLAGAYNDFRLTDTLLTYAPGTSQVVSYDHPADSPITGITALDIVRLPYTCNDEIDDENDDDDDTLSPSIIAGLPVTFDDQTADQGGSVHLRLPVDLPSGDYSYRLTLTTGTDTCHLHSGNFTSNGQAVVDMCAAGETKCLDASTFSECVIESTDVSGVNGTFTGEVQTCAPGTSCVQSGVNALCTSASSPVVGEEGACVIPGSMRCVNETAWQQCVGAGDQWSWAPEPQLCSTGTTCGVYLTDYIICQ